MTVIRRKTVNHPNDDSSGPRKFLMLLIAGFFVILVGVIILMTNGIFYGRGSTNFGAIVFIGPFPIVVGAGPEATLMVLFAIILAVLSIIMLLMIRGKTEKTNL